MTFLFLLVFIAFFLVTLLPKVYAAPVLTDPSTRAIRWADEVGKPLREEFIFDRDEERHVPTIVNTEKIQKAIRKFYAKYHPEEINRDDDNGIERRMNSGVKKIRIKNFPKEGEEMERKRVRYNDDVAENF